MCNLWYLNFLWYLNVCGILMFVVSWFIKGSLKSLREGGDLRPWGRLPSLGDAATGFGNMA